MDKIISTRIDKTVIQHIGLLAKKAVLANAVRCYSEKVVAGMDIGFGGVKVCLKFESSEIYPILRLCRRIPQNP